MPNYTVMPLQEQITTLEQESKNYRLRASKSMMWTRGLQELTDSEQVLGTQTDKLETAWKDQPGELLVAHARNSQSSLRRWIHNISENDPSDALDQINVLVTDALALAQKNAELFEMQWRATVKMWAMDQVPVGDRQSRADIEAPFRVPSGKLMDQIGDLYDQAGNMVDKATAGGVFQGKDAALPQQQGGGPGGRVNGGVPTGGGAPTGAVSGGVPTGDVAGADLQSAMGPIGTADAGGPPSPDLQAGLPQGGVGDIGTGGGGAGVDPELSGGLGAAPVTSPTLSGGPGGTGTGLPTGTGGGITPTVTSPVGLGGIGGGGGTTNRPIGGGPIGGGPGGGGPIGPITGLGPIGGGTGGSSGAKVPGLSLGGPFGGGGGPSGGGGAGGGIGGGIGGAGGGGTIPAAATPFEATSTAAPGSAAPTAPPPAAAAASAASGPGGSGGAPMMPPMGGMGGMGGGPGGGGPGSGAASRPTSKNRRKEVVTPGLPVMLSGKAGMADMNAFAGRGRKQVVESDVPTTVQLIDEDLWQVEQKPAAEERVVAPPVRRAH
jgi:hypothetical protein